MRKHKGFTLIELLIVIVVMGILASMMMVSSSESVSTARANNIITNLRNFSMAAMAYYTDNADTFGKTPGTAIRLSKVTPYMHNEGKIPDVGNYEVVNNSGVWWARYDASEENSRVKEKLEARASTANLCGSGSDTPPEKSGTEYPSYTSSHSRVWLLIRSGKQSI